MVKHRTLTLALTWATVLLLNSRSFAQSARPTAALGTTLVEIPRWDATGSLGLFFTRHGDFISGDR